MSHPRFDSYAIEALFDGTNWTDITYDVIGNMSGNYGISGNGPQDRIADVGTMTFVLKNNQINSAKTIGYYTPGFPSCRSGFGIGLKIRLRITFDGITKTKFYGRIPVDGIKVEPGNYSARTVTVTVKDWMDQAANHEMNSPAFAQNKRLDEIIPLIVANMDVAPLSTDYRIGQDTFASVFDTVRSKTRAMAEMAKAAMSELGFVYVKHSLSADEVLRVEGRYTRNNEVKTNTIIPVSSDHADFLMTEDGDYLMTEDGDYLVMDDMITPSFDNNVYIDDGMEVLHGKHYYNRVKVTAYPRKVDASPVVLFTLNNPMAISAGETKYFTGRYRDPIGISNSVSGINMVAPVATTDYTGNTASNGSGTDLTANFIVTPVYGTGDVSYAVKNNSASNGYLTKCNARGYGVYIYDPVDAIAEDAAGVLANGPSQLTMDLKYQNNPLNAIDFAGTYKNIYSVPRLVVMGAKFLATGNASLLSSFFYLEPGDRIHLKENVTGTDDDFFIQGVKFEIQPGGLVSFFWHLRNIGYDVFTIITWGTSTWDGTDVWGF